MFLLRRPSPSQIDRFLDQSRALPLSNGPTLAERVRNGGKVDELVVTIGNGQADFERACIALKTWKQFDVGWVQAFPSQPSLEPGTNVAVQIQHLGIWSLNGARVLEMTSGVISRKTETPGVVSAKTTTGVSVSPEMTPEVIFGFSYGTLTNHAESGQELFEVSIDRLTGDVSYRIRAVSRPQSPLAWLGFPMVRVLQARFRRDSADAMKRAVSTL